MKQKYGFFSIVFGAKGFGDVQLQVEGCDNGSF
jgi:hypothetical protein